MYFRWLERIFVFVLLISSIGVIDSLTRPPLEAHDPRVVSTEVPLTTAIAESAIYFCGTLVLILHWKRVARAVTTVFPIACFAALAPLSIAWSYAPLLTARRSVLVVLSTLLGMYLGVRFTVQEIARFLVQAMCVSMLAVLVLYCIAPGLIVDPTGAWRGLSGGKNSFGGDMAIAAPLLILIKFRRHDWVRYVFVLMCLVLLALSHSATSMVGCIVVIITLPLWRLVMGNQRLVLRFSVLALICVALAAAWFGIDLVLQVLGRDASLTGRTELWSLLVPQILKHPFLGYGYSGFWTGWNSDALNVYAALKWLPVGADNGYLDLSLAFGMLWIPVFICVYSQSARFVSRYALSEKRPIGLWPVSYVAFFGLHNICESHLLTTRSLEFLIFVAITTSIATRSEEHEMRPQSEKVELRSLRPRTSTFT